MEGQRLTRVVKFPRKFSVDITRPNKYSNPFIIGRDGTREEVIEKFRIYGKAHGLDVEARKELRGEVLGCCCKPLPCHGDVLVEWANQET